MRPFEINALIAEKVLGYEVRDGERIQDKKRFGIPSYCQEIEYAWEVVERLRESRIFSIHDSWDEDDKLMYTANFQYNDTYHAINYVADADTAPLAICLAALKSVGIEVLEESE